MNCVIIDDEPLAIQVLCKQVKSTPGLKLMQTFQNAFEGLYYIQTQSVDLVFLDIQMPGVNGLQFIKILKYPPKIIIVSAYKEHALEALQLGVIDYLLKPVSYERFLESISKTWQKGALPRVTEQYGQPQVVFHYVKEGAYHVKIAEDDICYLQGDRNYCTMQLLDRKLTLTENLSQYLSRLSQGKFLRVHKSYIVATDKIDKYNAQELIVSGTEIPIGRTYKQEVMKYFEARKF